MLSTDQEIFSGSPGGFAIAKFTKGQPCYPVTGITNLNQATQNWDWEGGRPKLRQCDPPSQYWTTLDALIVGGCPQQMDMGSLPIRDFVWLGTRGALTANSPNSLLEYFLYSLPVILHQHCPLTLRHTPFPILLALPITRSLIRAVKILIWDHAFVPSSCPHVVWRGDIGIVIDTLFLLLPFLANIAWLKFWFTATGTAVSIRCKRM